LSRLYDKPIEVSVRGKIPVRFTWKREVYQISKIINYWVMTGAWWAGESEKVFYRVQVNHGLFDIYYDRKEKKWYMYRCWD